MDIDFTRLRYFVAVAEELHFKRAADRLMITAPPLSKQIRLLEQQLGGDLFVRDYHSVALTPLGAELLEPARAVLRQAEAFEAAATGAMRTPRGIRIGATAYAPTRLLERLESWLEELPNQATLRVGGSAFEVAAQLVAGRLDLGVIALPTAERRLHYLPVWETPGAIAVRADDPLAVRSSIRVEELAEREVVIDFARANPPLLAENTRKLAERGVTHLAHAASGRGGELEMAAQIYNRRLVAMISGDPESFLARVFAPPQFAIVPLEPDSWPPTATAIAWLPERLAELPPLRAFIDRLVVQVASPDVVELLERTA